MNVAVLHDWFLRFSCEETILKKILKALPNSDLLTLKVVNSELIQSLNYRKLFQSKLSINESNLWKNIYKFQAELSKFDLHNYEVIFTNSMGPLRWIKQEKRKTSKLGATHIAYIHEPYPFIYLNMSEIQNRIKFGSFWSKFSEEDQEHFQKQDLAFAQGIDLAMTNSIMMQKKLKKLYAIDCQVISPPVNKSVFFPRDNVERKHFLVCSYAEPGYDLEVLLESFNYIKDRLIIIGDGTLKAELESKSRDNIHWLGEVDEFTRANLISESKAVIVTDSNHYHNIAREAAAMGVPIVCHRESSAFECIEEDVTGISYRDNSADGLLPAIFRFKQAKLAHESFLDCSRKIHACDFSWQLNKLLES